MDRMHPKPNEKATLCALVEQAMLCALVLVCSANANGCMCDVSPRVGSVRTRSDKASEFKSSEPRRETSLHGCRGHCRGQSLSHSPLL